jgi:hypothetical protein
MLEAGKYSAVELSRNGRRVEIRALRPGDRADLAAAVCRASTQNLYHRFFAVKRSFTEQEIAFFLNVDFVTHVALVAMRDRPPSALAPLIWEHVNPYGRFELDIATHRSNW